MMGLRAVAALGLVSIPLNYFVLKRLLAMVGTVRIGRPVRRRQRLPALQDRLDAGRAAAPRPRHRRDRQGHFDAEHPVDLDAGFSVNGWLAVLLTFVLARVFAEGTLMREDLEGTV